MRIRRGGRHGPSVSTPEAAADRLRRIPPSTAWPVNWVGFDLPWGREDEPDAAEGIAASMDRELAREVKPGHPLAHCVAVAIAKRETTDDVLYAIDDGPQVAVVHLTWAENERPPWPSTTMYHSLDAFLDDPDHAEMDPSQ